MGLGKKVHIYWMNDFVIIPSSDRAKVLAIDICKSFHAQAGLFYS
jgi:hypothetical protein